MKAKPANRREEKPPISICKFKLAVIATHEFRFSDAEIEKMFLDVEIGNERDIADVVGILAKHRPKLLAKLIAKYIRTA